MFGKKNNSDDDFNFDDGSELFPLDDPYSGTKSVPPKGTKGYLKNVVKSVKNAGIKLGTTFMPEVDSLVKSLRPDGTSANMNDLMNMAKSTIKKYGGGAIDIAKDVGKDVQNAVKTGNFIGDGSDDDMFGDMGDFGFDSDEDYGITSDSSDYDYDEDGKPIESNSSGASIQMLKTTVKTAKAQASIARKIGSKQIGATIGVAQAQIKNESRLFSQSMLLGQEQHQQKMSVMKNIAGNISKIINQNNLSLKAQMEYSLKSLAFSQDGAAMIKHIRDAQWKMVTPKEEQDVKKGQYENIFGTGIDKKSWMKNFMTKSGDGTGLSNLSMIKEMMESMGGMGDPKKMLKSMGYDMAFETAGRSILNKGTRQTMQRLNDQATGAPMAINSMLGRMSKDPQFLNKMLKTDNSLVQKLGGLLSTGAEYGHVDNMIKANTGKYSMGNPDEVHPFDNKAHKVLTEVIPAQLSKISAGINNTEEEFFDFKNNRFMSRSGFKRAFDQEKSEVFTYSEGFSEAVDSMSTKIKGDSDADKIKFRKHSDTILRALFEDQQGLTSDQIEMMGDPNSDLYETLTAHIPDEDKQQAMEYFVAGLISMRKEQPKKYRLLQNSMNKYAMSMSNVYRDHEDTMGKYGSSILFDETTRNTQLDIDDSIIGRKMRAKERLLETYGEDAKYNALRKKTRSELVDFKRQKRDISKYRAEGGTAAINDGMNNDDDSSDQHEDKYEMKMLSNTTTNGVVQNIYRLMLAGLDVYPQQKSSDERNKMLGNWRKSLLKTKSDFIEAAADKKEAKESAIKSSVDAAKTDREYREANYEEYVQDGSKVLDKVAGLPGIRTVLGLVNNIFGAAANPLAKSIDKNLYGIYDDESTSKNVGATIGKKIDGLGQSAKDIASGAEDKAKDFGALVELNYEEFKRISEKDGVKAAIKDLTTRTTTEAKTKGDTAVSAAKAALNKLKKENVIDNLAEGYDSVTNAVGNKLGQSKVYTSLMSDLKNDKDSFKRQIGKLKNSKGGKIYEDYKKMVNDAVSKQFGNIIVDKKTKRTLSDVLAEIKDVELLAKLKNEPNPVRKFKLIMDSSNSEICKHKGFLQEYVNKHPNLLKFQDDSASRVRKLQADYKDGNITKNAGATITSGKQALGNVLLQKIKVNGVTLEDKLAGSKNEVLKVALDSEKDPIKKAQLIIDTGGKEFEEYNTDLQMFISKNEELINGSVISAIKNKASKFVSEKIGATLNKKISSILDKKLGALKFGTKTLGQVIDDIKDPVFHEGIKACKTTVEKAQYIMDNGPKEIDPYKSLIREFIKNYKSSDGSIIGSVATAGKLVLSWLLGRNKKTDRKERKPSDYINNRIKQIIGRNGVPLEKVIDELLDKEGLGDDFSLIKNPLDQAQYLIENGGPGIKPYIRALKDYIKITNKEKGSSIKNSNKIKAISNKINNKIASIENDDSLTKEEKAEAIAKLKEEKSNKIKKVDAVREKQSDKFKSARNKKIEGADGIRKEGTLHDQKQDALEEKKSKQEEERLGLLATIAGFFKKADKDGLDLSKKTTGKLEDAAETAGEQGGVAASNGIFGKLNGFMNSTGLGKSKIGKVVGKGASFFASGGTAVGAGKKMFGKIASTSAAGKVGGLATKFGGIGKGMVGGAGKMGGAVRGIAVAGKSAAGIVSAPVKAVGKSMGFITKLIKDILTSPTISKFTGKTAANTLVKTIAKKIGEYAARFASKIATITASAGTMALAGAAVGFTKAMIDTKKIFKLGVGASPSLGMRVAAGLVGALDGALLGIPTIIAKLLKKGSAAEWFYELIGSQAEKAAIARYHRYNEMRAKIYGLDNSDSLVAYENHTALDKAGRLTMQILTLGLTKSNAEKEAQMLGFQDVKIFKYWKEQKYKPLADLREELAADYGGTRVVDKLYTFTSDKDGDGEIDEDQDEKAEKENEAISMQQEFRQHFLESARKYIIDNKLAWLGTKTDAKMFEKFTGEKVKGTVKTSDKLKRIGKYALAGIVAGPLGLAAVAILERRKAKKAAGGNVKDINSKNFVYKGISGALLKSAAGAFGKVKDIAKKFGQSIKSGMTKMGEGIKSGAKKIGDAVTGKISEIGTGIKNFVGDIGDKLISQQIAKIMSFYQFALKKYKLTDEKLSKSAMVAVKILCGAIRSACTTDRGYATSFVAGGIGRGLKLDALRIVAGHTMKKAGSVKEISDNLGVDIPEDIVDEKLKLISAMIALVNLATDYMDDAARIALNKTARYIIYDTIIKDLTSAASSMYEKSFGTYAEILGVKPANLKAFESKINENSNNRGLLGGAMDKMNVFGNIAKKFIPSSDPDTEYSNMLEFEDLQIYKHWYTKKYKGITYLGKSIAKKYDMSYYDLMSDTTGDVGKQEAFLKEFLTEAKKYVSQNGLDWLTYKTTMDEYNKRRKNKTLEIKRGYEDSKKKEAATAKTATGSKAYGSTSESGAYGKKSVDTTNFTMDAESDSSLIAQDLKQRYEYSDKIVSIVATASSSIKGFWTKISPNFFGDQSATSMPSRTSDGEMKSFGGRGGSGGAESVGEGLVVVDKTQRSKSSTKNDTDKSISSKTTSKTSSGDSYDLSGKTPKSKVMNSIVNDFAEKFGKELNSKLDILHEIQTENVRHNGVAENFFQAALTLMSQMAQQSGKSGLSSDIDRLVREIAR